MMVLNRLEDYDNNSEKTLTVESADDRHFVRVFIGDECVLVIADELRKAVDNASNT